MTLNRYRCTVGWGDCDPADIVFYPNYFRWFDEATWCLFESVGLTRAILRQDYNCAGMPLLEAKSKFLSPSRFHDALVIESRVSAWRDKTYDVVHKVMNGTNVAAEGQETRAWCEPHPDDPKRLKAQPIPKDIIAKLGS
jgi:4-hydroxybenzoyl-CoA thioesterase